MQQFVTFGALVLIVLCSALCGESAIAGDRLVFHVPINYKNVHMTKTRVKPVHHRTFQQTDYKVLGYSMDKHGHAMASMSPMEYLAKMQILRG
uniref:Peptidase S8 pro-domain domain-containing protein n=1 Tax=Anopheles farauti TaxID=69004 RepID=A0A182R0I1_9DIPT